MSLFVLFMVFILPLSIYSQSTILAVYVVDEIKTIRIDNLAEEGDFVTDYYAVAPICSLSRAVLLTEELTITELFIQNFYKTAWIGKPYSGIP